MKNFRILSAASLCIALGFSLMACEATEPEPAQPDPYFPPQEVPTPPCPEGYFERGSIDQNGEPFAVCDELGPEEIVP